MRDDMMIYVCVCLLLGFNAAFDRCTWVDLSKL